MKYFNYLCLRIFIWFLGVIPWWLSRGVCFFFVFLIYDVLRLRRAVVLKNIQYCFPEKSEQAHRTLARKSYIYMVETIVEASRFMRYGEEDIKARVSFSNLEVVQDYLDSGSNVVVWVGHFANSEAHSLLSYYLNVPTCCAYKPTKNPYIDRWLKAKRERFGVLMLPSKRVLSELTRADSPVYRSGEPVIVEMRADQRADPRRAFMLDFFGMECAFFKGPELIARRMKMPIFYMRSTRLARGSYSFELVELDAPAAEWGARTQQAVKYLEEEVRQNPEMYFWVHKRFKEVERHDISRVAAVADNKD
jgi:Kdo2-lipid IVA lauroyltransferase/acyltransferase